MEYVYKCNAEYVQYARTDAGLKNTYDVQGNK